MSISLAPFMASWPFLLKAVGVTLFISVLSMVLGLAIGVVVGSLRTYGGKFFDLSLGFSCRHNEGHTTACHPRVGLLRLSSDHRPLH